MGLCGRRYSNCSPSMRVRFIDERIQLIGLCPINQIYECAQKLFYPPNCLLRDWGDFVRVYKFRQGVNTSFSITKEADVCIVWLC